MKHVKYIISVPSGPFCASFKSLSDEHCPHFDNTHGQPKCMLGFGLITLERDSEGRILKPAECLALTVEPYNDCTEEYKKGYKAGRYDGYEAGRDDGFDDGYDEAKYDNAKKET